MPTFTNNLTLGRGKLYFGRFPAGTLAHNGMRYFGNTPAVNATVTEEVLEHFDSDAGLKVKDRVVTLTQEISGSFQTDNMSNENLALFFAAEEGTAAQTSVANQVETFSSIELGTYVNLGVTNARPHGHRGITAVDVVVNGTDTLVADTDYEVDLTNGRIYIMPTTTIVADGDTLSVTYDVPTATIARITDLSESIYGRLEYHSDNPVGDNFVYIWPYAKLTADGELALKGDEWQVANFNFEVLRLASNVPRQIILPA